MEQSFVVNTVLGEILSDQMGITFSHEHLALNPGDPIRYGDSVFDEPQKIIQDVIEFKSLGGKTIVEMTPLNFGRDVQVYRDISKTTGINVICSTGFHKEEFIPDWFNAINNRQIIDRLEEEINHGISDTGIRPGVIKIGTSYNQITAIEKRAAEIAVSVQQETSLPISTHCDKGTMALELSALLKKYGVHPDKVILGHVDIPNDLEYLKKICSMGFNVQIDHIGREKQNRDIVKVNLLRELIASGFINQIFLSGDMGKKTYLKSYGGWPGLGYILREFKASLLENGISEAEFEHILVKNPCRVFGLSS